MSAVIVDFADIRRRREQGRAALATAHEIVMALSAGEGFGWLREDGATAALGELISERLLTERPELFGSDIAPTVEAAS